MKHYLSLSLSLLVLMVAACKKKQPEFNEQLTIKASEQLSYNERDLMLAFETEKSMTCGAATLVGETSVSGNTITVNITGMDMPPNCQYAPSKIVRYFYPGKISDGSYSIVVYNGKHRSTGTLVITDQEINLSFSSLENLRVAREKVLRVPNGIIWGNVMYNDLSRQSVADSFINSLLLLGATPVSLPDGDYDFFNVAAGRVSVAYNGVNLYPYKRDFYFRFVGVTDSLGSLARSYATSSQPGNFYVRSWDGRNFNFPGAPVYVLKGTSSTE